MERSQHPNPTPSLFHLFTSFLRLGATAFGGPAMVAYIRSLAVEKKHWLFVKQSLGLRRCKCPRTLVSGQGEWRALRQVS
jgi:hypothetical protein